MPPAPARCRETRASGGVVRAGQGWLSDIADHAPRPRLLQHEAAARKQRQLLAEHLDPLRQGEGARRQPPPSRPARSRLSAMGPAGPRCRGQRKASGRPRARGPFLDQDRLASGRRARRAVPRVPALGEPLRGRRALLHHQGFPPAPPASAGNSLSPVSGSPPACAALIPACASRAAHSVQVNSPRSCSATAMAKACASHGSRNTGSAPALEAGRAAPARSRRLSYARAHAAGSR